MSLNINFFLNLTWKTPDNIFFTDKEVRSLPGVLRFLAGIIVGLAESHVGLAGSLVGLAGSLVGLDIIFRKLTESRVSADNIFSCYNKAARASPRIGEE